LQNFSGNWGLGLAAETPLAPNDLCEKRQGEEMDYFAAMRAFVRAVDLGSFSKAAVEERLKVSTVSRYISGLETDLGAALLNRSTRRLHLTEAGAAFYGRAVSILADVEDARLATMSLNASPQGLLRANVPGAFGRRHIVPHLKDFRDLHPRIRLDVTLTDETVNLIESGADVAVRIGALADSTLMARQLAPQHRMLVASPAYLERRGHVEEPSDLIRHDCLAFALQPTDAWYFRAPDEAESETREIQIHGSFRANDSEALLCAAKDGLGLALLPTWLLAEDIRDGKLIPQLPAWKCTLAQGPERAIWGVYPPKKTVSPKVRAFLAFFVERFGKPPYWDRQVGFPQG
jgi:DNA-binding transcriptional LysR family regulator